MDIVEKWLGWCCGVKKEFDDPLPIDVATFVKEGTCGICLAFSLSGSKSSISKLELASRLIRSSLEAASSSDWNSKTGN
jgi:hypothetical protein